MNKRPDCPTCKEELSVGASMNGKSKFFCINGECPDRFKTIDVPIPKEVARVDGSVICPRCNEPYRSHPQDPDYPWPTFVLLCSGAHAKV